MELSAPKGLVSQLAEPSLDQVVAKVPVRVGWATGATGATEPDPLNRPSEMPY